MARTKLQARKPPTTTQKMRAKQKKLMGPDHPLNNGGVKQKHRFRKGTRAKITHDKLIRKYRPLLTRASVKRSIRKTMDNQTVGNGMFLEKGLIDMMREIVERQVESTIHQAQMMAYFYKRKRLEPKVLAFVHGQRNPRCSLRYIMEGSRDKFE